MKFIIGIVIGIMIVSYYPVAGEKLRSVTNTVASEVESVTAPTPMKKLEDLASEYAK